jgi:transposase
MAVPGMQPARWYGWAVRSRLEPVKEVAAMVKRHLDGVLRFAKDPITNGVAEGIDRKIMSINARPAASATP